MQSVQLKNKTVSIDSHPIRAAVCDSFFTRFLGLMFRKNLTVDEGILLVENSDSRLNTSIHMFFMNFDIGVVWINSKGTVVDLTLAKRWKPYYAPRNAARYTLETHPDQLEHFQIGDKIEFIYAEK